MSQPTVQTAEPELERLRRFGRGRPPFTSVYLPVDRAREDARTQLKVEWRQARASLAEQGTPEDLLSRLEGPLADQKHGSTIALVVDGDGDLLVRGLPDPVPEAIASHGPLPRLAPLLALAQHQPPYVVVLADRRGADIITVVNGASDRVEEVQGDQDAPVRKVAAGGWSQRRYQQRAENTWEKNATGVAEEVSRAAGAVHASIVITAGDERALGLLEEHLPGDLSGCLHLAPTGGRATDGSDEHLQREIQRIVETEVAAHTVEVLRHFVELRERHATVADGPGATFAALRESLVSTLLIHHDPTDDRPAWLDVTAPSLVATEARTLRDLGREPVADRLVDVAIWSALGTGADIRLVPGSGPNVPAEGVGAFVRGPVST